MMESMPFKISISNELLSFIHQRVSTARIPLGLDLAEDPWSYGNTAATISHLRDYWEKKYDWRAVEARINGRLKMFTLPIKEAGEDLTMHFVHHRSIREGAVPLLSQHGWPGNFTEVDKIIDSLTFPTEPGQQAYHVVAPSLPGFVFSDGPKGGSFVLKNMAAVNNKLMHALGYEKYMVQGGDWGNIIARIMAVDFPENCVANSFQLYLIPGTAGHVEIYKNVKGKKGEAFESDFLSKIIPRNVDFGASIFPRDATNIPRWWAACTVAKNIVYWKEHDKGGHFASTEQPKDLVEDIHEFTKLIATDRMAKLRKVSTKK